MYLYHMMTWILVFGTVSKIDGDVVCAHDDYLLPNPIDCNSFYSCVNGVPVLLPCASDHEGKPLLVFDPNLKQCVFPHDYECNTSSETDSPIETTTDLVTEAITDLPTETTTDLPTKTTTDLVTEITTEFSTETTTDLVTETTTDLATEIITDLPTTDLVSETTTDLVSDTTTDLSTKPSTNPEVPGDVVCAPGDDLLPNPLDCNSFYQCANGVPVLFPCASDHEGKPLLVFDPNLKQCVFPHEYECNTSSETDSPTETTTDLVTEITTDFPTDTTTDLVTETTTDLTTEIITDLPTETTTDVATETTDLQSETTTDLVSETTTDLPTETTTDLVTEITIDLPTETTTDLPTETTTETTTDFVSETTTDLVSETTTDLISDTTTDLVSDTTTDLSTKPSPNPEGPVCRPGDTYLPNLDDCSSFYQCSNGVPILFYCAPTHDGEPPLNFDPILNVCVWPEDYPCQCHNKTDSISCLSTRLTSSRNCSFCFDNCFSTDFGDETPQCDSKENSMNIGCKSIDDSDCDTSVELRPDCENNLELCPRRKRNITVTFSIEKHPLDLYYLMDYSGSMHDDKNNLILLSSGLLDTLSSLTDNFHIGFGSFIDKPRYPFENMSENDYSFHNNLPLTSETGNFVQRVRDAPILLPNDCDIPEAHADAMTQVIECPKAIGWRNNTRRVVLVATDAIFHVAGDGPLGNIYAPYVDGCYFNANGFYTEQLTMDYPSVEQLARLYSRNQATTTVIFATHTTTLDFYEHVASQFKSAYVAILNTDSSNILDVVKSEFRKIQSKMEIEKSETNDKVHFKYFSNCLGIGGAKETKICENLPSSGNVTFTVELDLAKCPTDGNDTGLDFILNAAGLPRFFKVKLKFLCETS